MILGIIDQLVKIKCTFIVAYFLRFKRECGILVSKFCASFLVLQLLEKAVVSDFQR